MKLESTLALIASEIFATKDLPSAKQLFLDYMKDSKIKKEDRNKMITEVSGMTSLYQLHRYTANALLKYEGLGV